jgi:prolyl-tRNA synthetase
VQVLLDDRGASFGVAFKDAELLGIPTSVVVGKGMADGQVELKDRRSGEVRAVPVDEVVEAVVREVWQ